jgi:hypothetical protein
MKEPDPKMVSEVMRSFVLRRQRGTITCEWCRRQVDNTYLTRRYCSNACRQKAKRARAKEQGQP